MTYFRNIFSKLFTKEKVILGRWTMNYSKDHLDRKVYLANHDHCGPCGSISELPKLKGVNKYIVYN